jgi:tetratricopeptide (TPR) repeat protein
MLFAALLLAAALAEEPTYKDGVRLYEQVDLDGAIARFNEALAIPAITDVEKATLHAWIALSHAQLGRKDDATASFRAAVKLDRNVKLPALAPPDVEAQLEAARAELPAPAATPDPSAPVDPAGPGAVAPSAGPPLVSMITGGAGIALLLAGGATFAIGLDTAFRQAFEAEFNDDARALVDLAYLEYAVAGGLAGAGAVGLGAAVIFTLE